MVLTKTHKWQHEVKRRHLRILFLDLALILTVLAFTSYVIVKQVIVTDLTSDLRTIANMAQDNSSITALVKNNETRYLAILRASTLIKSPDYHLSQRMEGKLRDPQLEGGIGLAFINGFPKIYVMYKSNHLSMVISRKAHQSWFYFFMVFLVAFLFIFFHIQRLVGYRFLFSPALSEVRFYKKLNEAKETFFASIFHELGTPLTSLMSRLELLMETVKDPALSKSLENAYLEAQRISFLSTEQLHRARFEMGAVQMNVENIYPNDLLDSMAFRLEILLQHHEMTLVVTHEEEERVFDGDRLKLEQALINLITNAIKYAPHGKEIHLSAIQNKDETILEVRDQGQGIPPEVISERLQPFQRGNASTQKISSTGLGLYLVNRIVKLHKGTLTFQQHHPGFSVRIRLPYHHIG